MANSMPGTSMLGFAFSIDGTYDEHSTLPQQLFLPSDQTRLWTYVYRDTGGELQQISYDCPQNWIADPNGDHRGDAFVFANRSECSQHFSLKAGLKAGGGNLVSNFSVQFNAAYDQYRSRSTDTWQAVYQLESIAWTAALGDISQAALNPALQSDFAGLPDTYDASTAAIFFTFFNKYGTHFVRRIKLGGRLYYNIVVDKTTRMRRDDIAANLQAEYRASFTKVSGSVSAAWSEVSQQYLDSRQGQATAIGGDNAILNGIMPQENKNYFDSVEKWAVKIPARPGILDFTLEPIYSVFTGAVQAKAVQQAFNDYLIQGVDAESTVVKPSVFVGSDFVPAAQDIPPQSGGVQMVVINRQTGSLVSNQVFFETWDAMEDNVDQMYDSLASALTSYQDNTQVAIILAFWGMLARWVPTQSSFQQMLAMGAGQLLQKWSLMSEQGYTINERQVNYVVICIPLAGQGKGYEDLRWVKHPVFAPEFPPHPILLGADGRHAAPASQLIRVHKDLVLGFES